jgi:hypothetical protein
VIREICELICTLHLRLIFETLVGGEVVVIYDDPIVLLCNRGQISIMLAVISVDVYLVLHVVTKKVIQTFVYCCTQILLKTVRLVF